MSRVVVDDQAPDDVEAEAGAFADRLGREERVEEAVADLGGNPGAVVDDADHDALPFARARVTSTRPDFGTASSALSIRFAQI